MKQYISITIITVFVFACGFSFAGPLRYSKPPLVAKDLVRMSTHVVTGTIASFRVIESSTGHPVAKPAGALRPGQVMEIEVVLKEILQQPDGILSGKERLKVRFGIPGTDIKSYRDQILPKGNSVFFLCRIPSGAGEGDFFPFYGSSNMCWGLDSDSRDILSEVREWVEKLKTLK